MAKVGAICTRAGWPEAMQAGELAQDEQMRLARPRVLTRLESSLNHQEAGRLRGLDDWLKRHRTKAAAELDNASLELDDAELVAREYPGALVRVCREANAPRRADGTEMPEFDLGLEAPRGQEFMVVEVTRLGKPFSKEEQITRGAQHALSKIQKRAQEGAPVTARTAALIHFSLRTGQTDTGGSILDVRADGTIHEWRPDGTTPTRPATNFYDRVERFLPKMKDNRLLDELILVDQAGRVTRFFRTGDTWKRRETR